MTRKPSKFLALVFLIFLSRFNVNHAASFTTDLIHRDSLRLSSCNSSNPYERIRNALLRSHDRVKYSVQDISHKSRLAGGSDISADIIPDDGAYCMKFSVGTPAFETTAIADTGSDLIWIQCKPCVQCFKQDAPIFEPNRSSSYKNVSCHSEACKIPDYLTSCNADESTCGYTVEYGDGSYSQGDVSTETITLNKTSFPNIVMGCGHLDQGTFGSGTSGIVGLGGGKVSLITQLGSSIEHKFSYCLIPLLDENEKSSSKLHFGQNAVVSGAGVVSTPIVPKSPKTFFYLTLEGITVGNKRLDLLPSNGSERLQESEEGNIIIDSGTTLTYIPTDFYSKLREALRSQVQLPEIKDPQGLLDLCFQTSGDEGVPEMTAHFQGADVQLKPVNTFIRTANDSLCLAFSESGDISIYGNVAQVNFLVGYDLEKKTVSFKPTDCAGQ